jgi:hypothetical protein
MTPAVLKALQDQNQDDEFVKKMLGKCRENFKCSRDVMSQNYAMWDSYDNTFKGLRYEDEKDVKARERREPTKTVIPMSYAQIMAWVAFCQQMFHQRPYFYELTGMGVEDWKPAKIAEALMQRDLDYNAFYLRTFQVLLDIGRFGLGIIKNYWTKETRKEWTSQPQQNPGTALGGVPLMFAPPVMQLVDKVKFLGNKFCNVSPYRWFPDPTVSTVEFQEGEFVGSEQDVSKMWLRRMQKEGYFAGCEHIKDYAPSEWESRKENTRTGIKFSQTGKDQSGVLLGEMQFDIIPSEEKVNGEPIGMEDYPVRYVCNIANDNRVIRLEPLGYIHGNFTYYAAQLTPDQHTQVNAGVSELIDQLQDIMTWLFNSRITSVRKTIQNQLIVAPDLVEMEDIKNRNPVIRLKKGVTLASVDRAIKQLNVQDVTASHVADAQAIESIIELVTSINQNAQGQYSKGRRSAAQTEAVNAGAGTRIKMSAALVHWQLFKPLGEDALSNLRDGLDIEQIVRVMGLQTVQPISPYAVGPRDIQQFLGVTKADLVGNYDFKSLDTTMASERKDMAFQLQELFKICASNPQLMMMLGIDLKALMSEIAELMDIRNPERFFLQQPQQQAMLMAAQQGAGINPDMSTAAASTAGSARATQMTAGQGALPQLANVLPPNVAQNAGY